MRRLGASSFVISVSACASITGIAPAAAQSAPLTMGERTATSTQLQPRGDVGGSSRLTVTNATTRAGGRLVTADVLWNQEMINQPGNKKRFSVRLIAIGPDDSVLVLNSKVTKRIPTQPQRVRMKLSASKAASLRGASRVALVATQQYGRAGKHEGRYFQQQVAAAKIKPGDSSSWGRTCSKIIRPGVNVAGCNLVGANFSHASLKNVDFSDANLSASSLKDSNVQGTKLAGANLTGANVKGAVGTPANGSLTPPSPTAERTVSYSGNGNTGGTPPTAAQFMPGATVTAPANTGGLVRTGYVFSGWNTGADGNGTDYPVGATFVMPATALTLYAKWIAEEPPSSEYSFSVVNTTAADGGNPYWGVQLDASWPCTAGTCTGSTNGIDVTEMSGQATTPHTVAFVFSPKAVYDEGEPPPLIAYGLYTASTNNSSTCEPTPSGGTADSAAITCTILEDNTVITFFMSGQQPV